MTNDDWSELKDVLEHARAAIVHYIGEPEFSDTNDDDDAAIAWLLSALDEQIKRVAAYIVDY